MYPKVSISAVDGFKEQISRIFHLEFDEWVIQSALDAAVKDGHIIFDPLAKEYILSHEAHETTLRRISDADDLSDAVRNEWLSDELGLKGEEAKELWDALLEYMVRTFRRHGLESIKLLKTDSANSDSLDQLKSTLTTVVNSHCNKLDRKYAEAQISGFFKKPTASRTRYITQLLDLTFGIFGAQVATPLTADFLRQNLKSLAVFVDTNVIFSIFGLHDHPLNDVTQSVINLIRANKLPIKLYYHEETIREFGTFIKAARYDLGNTNWQPSVSRAFLSNVNLSVLERKFHETNAQHPIDVGTFLSYYERIENILNRHGFEKYLFPPVTESEEAEVYQLSVAYEEYMSKANTTWDRTNAAIYHDMKVWRAVASIQPSHANSIFDAHAIFMTADYHLYRFDRTYLKKPNTIGVVVLPQHLAQIFRFLVPPNDSLDENMVKAFAIPEIASIRDPSDDRTKRRILTSVNQYQSMSASIASYLVADDIVNSAFEITEDDNYALTEIVDSALVRRANELEKEVAKEREQAKTAEAQHLAVSKELQEKEKLKERQAEELRRLMAEIENNQANLREVTRQKADEENKRGLEEKKRSEAEQAHIQSRQEVESLRSDLDRLKKAEENRANADAERDKRSKQFIRAVGIGARIIAFLLAVIICISYRHVIFHGQHIGGQIILISLIFIGFAVVLCKPNKWEIWLIATAFWTVGLGGYAGLR